MPNNVYSSMTITGAAADIKAFAEKHFDGSQFDLSSFVSMPEELEGTTAPSKHPNPRLVEKYGFDNWYDWCIQNWGTKWNTYDGNADVMDEVIDCDFQTAWNLPVPIFEVMGKMYPTLTFNLTCVEEGGFFSGTLSIINGVVDTAGITNDSEQWKNMAADILGWVVEEDDD